jgi:hypothetical protein
MWYANYNKFGSDTSVGFDNTNQPIMFYTRRARDAFVSEFFLDNLSVRPITAKAAAKLAGPRDPSGHRQYTTWDRAWGFTPCLHV